MTVNVRLKHKDRANPTDRSRLIELAYVNLGVPLTRVFPTNDGYKMICRNDKEADKVLSSEAKKLFFNNGLVVVMPPEMKARRSVFVRKVDPYVGRHSAEEIKAEIERNQPSLRIEEVIKIKDYTHVFKIVFEETAMVEIVLNNGFLAYNMSLTPDKIEREKFTSLLICFSCYKYEDHTTNDCQEKDKKLCSKCAGDGHTYTECVSASNGCLNCKRNGEPATKFTTHSTLAMSCPIKKRIILTKEEQEKRNKETKEKTTYAEIAKQAAREVTANNLQPTTLVNLSEATHVQAMLCMLHAHLENVIHPGTYASKLNQMLEHNKLPKMWFPADPDSAKLFGASITPQLQQFYQGKQRTATTEVPEEQEVEEQEGAGATAVEEEGEGEGLGREQRVAGGTKHSGAKTKPKKKDEHQPMEVIPLDMPKVAQDVGLILYQTTKIPYPPDKPTGKNIQKWVDEKKVVWQYTDKRYDEDLIWTLITHEQIRITVQDIKPITESEFRKKRRGLIDRSPGQQQKAKR